MILSGAMAYAQPQEVTLKTDLAGECEGMLAAVKAALSLRMEDLFQAGPAVLHAGVYRSLRKLALSSGMSRATAIQAIALVERVLEPHRNRDDALGSTLRYLQKYERDGRHLLVCVTEGNCRMPVGTIFIPDESRMVMGLPGQAIHAPLDHPIPHLILINGGATPFAQMGVRAPGQVEAIGWAVDFLTAAVSYAAFELVTDWVEANTRLLQAGEESDQIFDQFVLLNPTRINSGFFRAYTSSLASSVSMAVTPSYEDAARKMAMMEIEAVQNETRDVMSVFDLRERNIIEFGAQVSKQMTATIRRAALR